jgi:3-hydroxybutyryl-CoA dehydrogenase
MQKPLIAVIGAGLMGHGIAQIFASYGHRVAVYDKSPDTLDTLRHRIGLNLRELGQDASAAERVFPHPELGSAVRDADFIFEAGPENLELKRQLFKEVEQLAPAHALLASNTSVIPITQIMAPLERQERSLGTHWWNPPYLVPLVEVIQTEHTDPWAIEEMTVLLRSVGKTPVTVKKDVPGFIGNRLQHAMWREAIALVERGVCDAETVDTVVKSSFGMRLAVLGPLENADLVGTELTLAVHEHVLPDLDRTPGPLPYLKKLIEDGHQGMKNGSGFRNWTEEQKAEVHSRLSRHLKMLNEVTRASQPKED